MPSIKTNKAQAEAIEKVSAYLDDLRAIQACTAPGWAGDIVVQFRASTGNRKDSTRVILDAADKDAQLIVRAMFARQRRICKDIRALSKRYSLVLDKDEEALVRMGESEMEDTPAPETTTAEQPPTPAPAGAENDDAEAAAPDGEGDFEQQDF